MIKLYTLLSLLCITSFNATQCMLSEFKYKPFTQEPDLITAIHRTDVERWIRFSERGTLPPLKDIAIVRDATIEEQCGTCFNHAIAKATGNTVLLEMYRKCNKQISTINIEKYFEQTPDPQNNDVGLYTDNENTYMINHATSVFNKDKNILESKFGNSKKIVHHQPFAIPIFYGNTISYWTLKPKYKNDPEKLKKNIRNDAESFNDGESPYKKIKTYYA